MKSYRILVPGCFFLSGATALAYEVVWVRMLSLIFGATTLSVGTVLACYMAGLALGSWYWSRRADANTAPLRIYGLLEAAATGTALLTPILFKVLQAIYSHLFVGGLGDFTLLSGVRFLFCLPALIIPTFFIGGTLPLLVRFSTPTLSQMGQGVGSLYSINTLGAVVGSLSTGFVLIPALGVTGTLLAAAALNGLVAIGALMLSARTPALSPAQSAPAAAARGSRRALAAALVGFGVSGFSAMIFEVTWTRALVLVFGNSTYAFTTMLASFLVGLALGAALAGRLIDRTAKPYFVFAALQVLVGAWAAAATGWIQWLPHLFLEVYARLGDSFLGLQAFQLVVCILLMLPTTMALGATFPVVSRIASLHYGVAGRSAGVPYAANTLGTVLGAVTAGFILLPHLGIEKSIAFGTLLNVLIFGFVLATSRERALRPAMLAAMPLLAMLAAARLLFLGLDMQVLSAGFYIHPDDYLALQKHQIRIDDEVRRHPVLFYREGYASSIVVLGVPNRLISLQANGKTDASTGDLSTQRILAHLPLLLRPGARRVLVVGLASGCTAGSCLLHPVQRVDCVEIEPTMLQAARMFDRWNHHALEDGRLHVVLQDARNYVAMSRNRYDVITAEPTNPWIAGVNNLFTQEYYRSCRDRLEPGGLMCQWLPLYNFSEPELQTALGTFRSVFPYVTLWAFPGLRQDFFAIGTLQPLTIDPLKITTELQTTAHRDLASMGIENLWQFSSGLLMQDSAIQQFCKGAQLDTDENSLLEYSTPRHLYELKSKAQAIGAAYAAGAGSALSFNPGEAPGVLAQLKVRLELGPDLSLQSASLIPHHPASLNPYNHSGIDTTEIRIVAPTPSGPVTLHAAPLPRDNWPQTLSGIWASSDPASKTGSSPVTREYELPAAHAALLGDTRLDPHSAERLQWLSDHLHVVPN